MPARAVIIPMRDPVQNSTPYKQRPASGRSLVIDAMIEPLLHHDNVPPPLVRCSPPVHMPREGPWRSISVDARTRWRDAP